MNEYQEKRRALSSQVSSVIATLQREQLDSELPQARARLAMLRGAVDERAGDNPEVWQIVLGAVPEDLHGKGDDANAYETAAHAALTLYAVHQRGNSAPMHVLDRSHSLGFAAGRLVGTRTKSAKGRYDAVATAASWEARMYHLRSLVGLLSADGIPLDYGQLAEDLIRLQSPQSERAVNLRWGRDFFRAYSRVSVHDSETEEN